MWFFQKIVNFNADLRPSYKKNFDIIIGKILEKPKILGSFIISHINVTIRK